MLLWFFMFLMRLLEFYTLIYLFTLNFSYVNVHMYREIPNGTFKISKIIFNWGLSCR